MIFAFLVHHGRFAMNNEEELEIAFCWYERKEWEKLKETAADSSKLDDSYEEWKTEANSAISEIRALGHNIRKISINIDAINHWCQKNNLKNISESRSQYAAEKLRKRSNKI